MKYVTRTKRSVSKKQIYGMLFFAFLVFFLISIAICIEQKIQEKKEIAEFTELRLQKGLQDLKPQYDSAQHIEESDDKESIDSQALYDHFHTINKDYVGWIQIPETKIDYPVMYTPEEPEYYLRRAFDKTESISGTPFIGENGTTESDYFIIYGHNMKNGTMFGELDVYKDECYYKENPCLFLYTAEEKRTYEFFAAVQTRVLNTNEDGIRFYRYSGDLSKSEFETISSWLTAEALYDTGITPSYGDQILILSTCDYHINNGRFIAAFLRRK